MRPINNARHAKLIRFHGTLRQTHVASVTLKSEWEKKKKLFEVLWYEERQRGEDNKENMMKDSKRRRVAMR